MFLGNLSTAQERKARKGGGAAKVTPLSVVDYEYLGSSDASRSI